MPQLNPGDRFPAFEWRLTDGATLRVPDGLAAGWNVILFYRGHF